MSITELIIDAEKNTEEIRQLSENEIKKIESDRSNELAKIESEKQEEASRAAKKLELLAKLGITEEDVRVLLS